MSDTPVRPAVLVVDDDPSVHHLFRAVLDGTPADLLVARTGAEAVRLATEHDVGVVFIDLVLPDRPGLDVFGALHERDPRVLVVLMAAGGTSDTAIEAIKNGAYEYLLKPLDLASLRALVARAWEIRHLMTVPVTLAGVAEEPARGRDLLVGRSAAMQEVFKAIGRVAARDVTVLIRGESGTGKELIARAIYTHSHRADRPFLAINCAAIPEALLESELFGHERGAFTGADRTKIGKFEQFSGGTLFLDEIGDMSAMLQSKVLRVLQEQQFQRVGGNETIHTDVRILAATNRNLERSVEAGGFREDLYYRLNGYTITAPPLRARPDDIPALVNHFLAQSRRELGKPVRTVADEAMARLARYAWPGNVRELQNVIRRSLLQASGQVLLADFLPLHVGAPGRTAGGTASRALEDVERLIEDRLRAGATDLYDEVQAAVDRHLILRVLQHTGGNQHEAAALLGLSRNTLRAKIRSLDIRIDRSVRSGS
ncbi:MAG: sigma-54-dependent Fis family transcriptional regulator [Planctomycetes bacterium]|nr:sigma-54-dependent Fis family transcriptional regulator [Planctomycetota bacterium]